MFCPKCGTQNPDDGRFCRSCGTNLGNVSSALSGKLPVQYTDASTAQVALEARRRQDPNELFGDSIKQILVGIGFLFVAGALLTTGVAGGKNWWWAMLFPAFGSLGKGVSDYLKSKRIERKMMITGNLSESKELKQPEKGASLPPSQTDYIQPPQKSIYDTGELEIQPSVTENTTRHLELNKEGETMTLPKNFEK